MKYYKIELLLIILSVIITSNVFLMYISSPININILFYENILSSITFCFVPMPITTSTLIKRPHIVPTYLAAFSSWLSSNSNSKILSLIPREEFDPKDLVLTYIEQTFGKDRFYFTDAENSIETDNDGLPFIDDWFVKGYDYVKQNNLSDMICYINSDILIPQYWYEKTNFLYTYFKNKFPFIVFTRRCDTEFVFNFSSPYDIMKTFQNYSYEKHVSKKILYSISGIDLFLLPMDSFSYLNIDEIPPFLMSKYRWDPWMVGWFLRNINIIFLGSDFCIYHVNHNYIPNLRNIDPKIDYNIIISDVNNMYSGQLDSAQLQILQNRLYNRSKFYIDLPYYFYFNNYP